MSDNVEGQNRHVESHCQRPWYYIDKFNCKVFSISYALSRKYHFTKNVRSRVKPAVVTKQIKGEDDKMVKAYVIMVRIIDAWNVIINSSPEELYVYVVICFMKLFEKYPYLLKHVESRVKTM